MRCILNPPVRPHRRQRVQTASSCHNMEALSFLPMQRGSENPALRNRSKRWFLLSRNPPKTKGGGLGGGGPLQAGFARGGTPTSARSAQHNGQKARKVRETARCSGVQRETRTQQRNGNVTALCAMVWQTWLKIYAEKDLRLFTKVANHFIHIDEGTIPIISVSKLIQP